MDTVYRKTASKPLLPAQRDFLAIAMVGPLLLAAGSLPLIGT